MSDLAALNHAMMLFYQSKSERLEQENSALWGVCLDLLSAVIAGEHNGQKVIDLKMFADVRLSDCIFLLERKTQ